MKRVRPYNYSYQPQERKPLSSDIKTAANGNTKVMTIGLAAIFIPAALITLVIVKWFVGIPVLQPLVNLIGEGIDKWCEFVGIIFNTIAPHIANAISSTISYTINFLF